MTRLKSVQPLQEFKVFVEFTDGTTREIDLNRYLHGPIFDAIRTDSQIFRSVKVEHGTLVWPNGADIDPDVLFKNLTPAWMEEPKAANPR